MKRDVQKYGLFIIGILILCSPFYLSGCETTFDPLQENKKYDFSVFGALDLSADTQWVRVMPITDSLFTSSRESLDVVVTLTRESSGETIVMKDSLLQYSDNVYAWNYWTTMPLYALEKYSVNVEAPDGRYSSATVTMPQDFPPPIIDYSVHEDRGTVRLSNVNRVVVAQMTYMVQAIPEGRRPLPLAEVNISHMDDLYVLGNGDMQFYIDDRVEIADTLFVPANRIIIRSQKLLIASAGPEWPDFEGLSDEEVALPNLRSNIENGLGLLVGVATQRKTIQ